MTDGEPPRSHHHQSPPADPVRLLVIRPLSGLSGDMLAAGLLGLAGAAPADLEKFLADLNLSHLVGRVALADRMVNRIAGLGLKVDLPEEHEHRNLKDIEAFLAGTSLSESALALAGKTFRLLAEAEGAVHGQPPEDIHFHEVGALDSLLDIGLAALLLDRLSPRRLVCGPLPLRDGVIQCRHGLIPSPAPAVLKMLPGVAVTSLAGSGETVTPTALAFLKSSGAEFGPWPEMIVERQALAYGTRIFEDSPNGA
ncbi:MAG: LarC family nickel insertion protein, partial [Candidatus Adiutrix sp.]|nr:LarC family nickel insertion protein [Candidatus Adiutrix sp.]